MPSTDRLTESPRKELHVFYVLDTSGSMDGAKISALNHAMEECTEALKTLAKSNGDAKLKIAVMEFNSGCKWITSNGPEDLEEDFEYEYLQAGGLTDIGAALRELNNKLSRHAFLNSMTGALMPVIIFMTDGYATDDYTRALEEIRKNRWFARGTKIGFALGDDPVIELAEPVPGLVPEREGQHAPPLLPGREGKGGLLLALARLHGDARGLPEDDPPALRVNKGIGSTEVDSDCLHIYRTFLKC